MKNRLLLLFIFLVFVGHSFGISSDTTFWRKNADFIDVKESEVGYGDATILEDNRFVFYKANTREVTRHRIVHIKTQEGLDANNKVIVYVPSTGKIVTIKARSISKNGDVVELNKSNIKEIKDYSENGNLKVFAIEGGEIGGQIEYTYTLVTPLYDGGIEAFSMKYRTLKASVYIGCIKYFFIDSNPVNFEYEGNEDKLKENKYLIFDIMPIEEEKYATANANRLRVEYKFLGNGYKPTDYASYDRLLTKMHYSFFMADKSSKNKVKSLLKKKFDKGSENTSDVIRNLTVFLKNNFVYEEVYNNPDYETISKILKLKVANDKGMAMLYSLALDYLEIEHNILITCNKYEARLDPDYCSRYTLGEYIIYFPKLNTYLYPSTQVGHYEHVPSWLAGNQSLVVSKGRKKVTFQEIESADFNKNKTSLTIDVDMNLTDKTSIFNINAFGTGEIAFSYNQDMYYSDSEEEKTKDLNRYVSWRYPESEIIDVKMIDSEKWGDIEACEDYECKREFSAQVKSVSFFNEVGSKILVNVGKLIGPQTEMYSELERVQPISNPYEKSYAFRINLPIPDGYKYSGIQNGEMDNYFKDDNDEFVARFKSEVKVVDRMIQIDIVEFYAFVNLDKKYYSDYREVINSAADFNKAIILFEKE